MDIVKSSSKTYHLVILVIGGLLISCGTTGQYPSTSTGAVHRGNEEPGTITRSLFDSKDRTISEEDIQRLLNGKIQMPETVRIALFKYASSSINRYYANWWSDEEYLKTQQNFIDTLIREIGVSKNVKRIVSVPSMVTSASPNITQLRETAVRLQADLLVVFTISSDIYYKYKMFDKNEAKAFATCEAIVLDTRTGVIPFSTIVTKEKLVKKDQSDLTNTETRKKAEREAILLALVETGEKISKFLEGN